MTELLGLRIPKQAAQVALLAVFATTLGVGNRVLYKMALVPLKDYPFFLAQLTTFGYVFVYWAFLAARYKAGIVTDEMLALPKERFGFMGALEAVGLASGMAAAAVIPGALIPILTQTFLVWQLALSSVILGKKYTPLQLVGSALVLAGVVTVVSSGTGAGDALGSAGLWPLLLIVSTAFPAGASILKEFVFKDASSRLKGGNLDIFVVNSLGSTFQAFFVFLLLPVLSKVRGIPLHELPAYLKAGTACFLGAPGCEGAPLVPLLYVAGNLAFNISMLTLLKASSAVVASFTATLSVPLTIWAFTFPLPLLGHPAPLPPGFWSGGLLLVVGLGLYNWAGSRKKEHEAKHK